MRSSRRRWWVLRALGRNPLVRGADRLEAWAVILAAVVAVSVIPQAIDVGQNTYDTVVRTAETQAQTRTQVEATVVADTTPTPMTEDRSSIVDITWTANDSSHTGSVQSSRLYEVGDTIPIWVDQTGRRVPAPISADSAGSYAAAAAVAAWLGAAVLCGLVLVAIRAVLDRRRARSWSAELRVLLDRGDGRTKWHH
ncbi:Rv1733c family protein [Mycolicibacterium houstonense]|uniref:Rv1733c family protein n=1 Tax=Mycolicibacterium houstonense TaxID=146021 RepID=UPI003F9E768C